MSRHLKKDSRRSTAVKIALVALAMGGGATLAHAKHAAQSSGPASQEASQEATVAAAGQTVTLYKSPTCTCCGKWGDHLRQAGFEVQEVTSQEVAAVMEERGVPMHLRSCHLGVVGDYVVVGHVPADLVARLLAEKPAATGIAVPGMPLGSPGMEALGRTDRYEVIAFGPEGEAHVFATR